MERASSSSSTSSGVIMPAMMPINKDSSGVSSAAQALEDGEQGRHTLMFPTMANLARLAAHPSFGLVQQHLAQTPIQVVSPRMHEEDGMRVLRIPEGLGYPVTSLVLRGAGG